ncbi:MAG: PIN domain-containing protein [Anaerolineae bacterium]|nr:PIN domain-containing protein [Anaerolineae bacterium]
MSARTPRPGVYFLDTSYIIALFSPRDPHHANAQRAARQVAKANQKLVTTEAVLTEIGNGLSKLAFRHQAARIISELQTKHVQIYQ